MDKLLRWLNDAVEVNLGNIRFSVLTSIRGAIAGSLLFWLGAVWNALKDAGIEMPCPPRGVELRTPAA